MANGGVLVTLVMTNISCDVYLIIVSIFSYKITNILKEVLC